MVHPFHKLKHLYVTLLLTLWCGQLIAQQIPAPGTLTADELNAKANTAFKSGDFANAEGLFIAFERDFGAEPGLEQKIETNTALIALCMITNGRGSQAGPYIERALKLPELPTDVLEELSFWDAVVKLQAEQYRDAQESLGRFFKNSQFDYTRRLEALVLFGTCYSLQGYNKTTAEFFRHQIPNLRKAKGGKNFAARAVVLQMMALIQSKQYDSALELLQKEYPNLEQLNQVISFQTLALSLGSHYMESADYYSAIACLQRIWPQQKLITHQQEKLAELKKNKEALASNPRAQDQLFQVDGAIKRVQRELDNFSKVKDFDAALRLRLAIAFQSLKRYREAALIMEDMLQRMQPSPLVESASLAVIQCWSELERWPKALESAENYLQTFGEDATNKNLPQVLFMHADALLQLQQLEDAENAFISIADSFPTDKIAARALFMSGFTQLQQDKNEQAVVTFDTVLTKIDSADSLAQDAFYWKATANSFIKNYDQCFEQMNSYLSNYKDSGLKYESEAVFRKAYCTFCKADYQGAITQFHNFLTTYGTTAPDRDEALLLLGDAQLGEGKADAGIKSYAAINPKSQRFFEDGVFKTGKAYKLLQKPEKMRQHYEKFLADYPKSKRMPEAVYWLGWTYVNEQKIEQAKEVYWKTILEHGNNPELFAIEELLLGLPKVYKHDGPRGMNSLDLQLQKVHIQADSKKQYTLAIRALWAEAMLLKESDTSRSEANLIRIANLIDPEVHNPQIIADVADSLVNHRQLEKAEKLYNDLRKWNPNSFHKSRAYQGLGLIAEKKKRFKEAIRHYKNFEKSATASTSLATIQLKRIRLEMLEGDTTNVKASLEQLLESPTAGPAQKAEALFLIGESLSHRKEYQKATAYYERVYVAYGKYRQLVAKSYYRRGEALEALNEKGKAYEVYLELRNREELKEFDEFKLARKKIDALQAFAPESEPQEGPL